MKLITVAEIKPLIYQQFPEREQAIDALFLALLAREHAIMIGPPGTAKSLIARTVAECTGRRFFSTLLHAFTVPEELFGGISMVGLQKDEYRRNTANYLPEAEVAMLDEVFKCNAGSLNGLLTMLNERLFYNDGKPVQCPLMSCIGASNELQEGPQLDALYDRFMVRVVVDYMHERDAFTKLLKGGSSFTAPGKVDLPAEQKEVSKITVTNETVEALADLRQILKKEGFQPSDRRWKNSLGLLRANAHLNGKSATDGEDLEVLEHVLWNKPDERVKIAQLVQKTVSPTGAAATQELDNAKEIFRKLPAAGQGDTSQYLAQIGQAVTDMNSIYKKLSGMSKGPKVDKAIAEVKRMKQEIGKLALISSGVEV